MTGSRAVPIQIPDADVEDLRTRLPPVGPTRSTAPMGLRHPVGLDEGTCAPTDRRLRLAGPEAALNRHDQFRTEIDGIGVHLYHVRSRARGPAADHDPRVARVDRVPEGHRALTDPAAHGGDPADRCCSGC